MKSASFDYIRPETLDVACACLASHPDARIIAGGQSLVPMLAMRLARPSLVIDIAHIGGLSAIRDDIALSDMHSPYRCQITVSGEGTLGTGTGTASVVIADEGGGKLTISYEAGGDVSGLIAGVGQRVLMGVAKHLTRQFFTSLKKQFSNPTTTYA